MLLLAVTVAGYSQNEKYKFKTIGLSVPIIWNNSEATYYALGNAKYPSGERTSYGVNLNYSGTVYKNLFGIVGIGYFKQAFGIQRPFEYIAPDGSKPLVYTSHYAYHNVHFLVGVGYKKALNETLSLNGQVIYNIYNSYRQRYSQQYFPGVNEVYKKSMSIGRMINLNVGVERKITPKISTSLGALLPISTHWNNDEIFVKYVYSDDTQQIARNKFSIGIAISCNYSF